MRGITGTILVTGLFTHKSKLGELSETVLAHIGLGIHVLELSLGAEGVLSRG